MKKLFLLGLLFIPVIAMELEPEKTKIINEKIPTLQQMLIDSEINRFFLNNIIKSTTFDSLSADLLKQLKLKNTDNNHPIFAEILAKLINQIMLYNSTLTTTQKLNICMEAQKKKIDSVEGLYNWQSILKKIPGEHPHIHSYLHIAAHENDIPLMHYLIAHKADVNKHDSKGETPLFHAIDYFKTHPKEPIDSIEILLDAGADINVKNIQWIAPLQLITGTVPCNLTAEKRIEILTLFLLKREKELLSDLEKRYQSQPTLYAQWKLKVEEMREDLKTKQNK